MSLVEKVINSIFSIAFKFPWELVNEISYRDAMVMMSRGDPGDKVGIEHKIIKLAQRGRNSPTHRCHGTRGRNSPTCRYHGTTGCLHSMTCSSCSTLSSNLKPMACLLDSRP